MGISIYDPEPQPLKKPARARPKQKKTAKPWTMVARGPKDRGHRFMISAVDMADAHKVSIKLCKQENLDFVAVFAGHMARLR